MININEIHLEAVTSSQWVKLYQVKYKEDNLSKTQNILKAHNSCAVLIHNITRNVLVFVNQFRPVVFLQNCNLKSLPSLNESEKVQICNDKTSLGFTLEICAGILDKPSLSVAETAAEEVFEECGYLVSADNLKEIWTTCLGNFYMDVTQKIFYVAVTDQMKHVQKSQETLNGLLEVVEYAEDVFKNLKLESIEYPLGLVCALDWFYNHKDNYPKNNLEEKLEMGIQSTSLPTISDFSISPSDGYNEELQIYRMIYNQGCNKASWDMFIFRHECGVLIHNTDSNSFILRKQFKPALFSDLLNEDKDILKNKSRNLNIMDGFVNQICMGKLANSLETAAKRAVIAVREDFFYEINESDLLPIIECRNDVGISGSKISLFYVKVSDKNQCSKEFNNIVSSFPKQSTFPSYADNIDEGGSLKNPTRNFFFEVAIDEALDFIFSSKINSYNIIFSILWFFRNKSSPLESL